MVRLKFDKASLLFPTRTPPTEDGIGAKIITRKGKHYIVSLNQLSIDLKAGDRVALIGQNGSGKSTLLRLAAGIYVPTEGSVSIEGRPATLFSTTVGLSVDVSAAKNIRDGATLLNIPRDEIDDLVKEIIEFAELQRFADLPMRVYSSGMRARMGFGLVTSHNADILLIDEVFGTGDSKFYAKAKERLEKKMEQSSLLLLASHSESLVKSFCNKALWLHQGETVEYDDVDIVFNSYKKFTSS